MSIDAMSTQMARHVAEAEQAMNALRGELSIVRANADAHGVERANRWVERIIDSGVARHPHNPVIRHIAREWKDDCRGRLAALAAILRARSGSDPAVPGDST